MLLPIIPYLSSRSLTLISFTDLFFSTFLTGISFPVLQRKEKLYAPASHLLRMFLIIKFKLWLHIISRLCFNNGRAKLQLKHQLHVAADRTAECSLFRAASRTWWLILCFTSLCHTDHFSHVPHTSFL